jgi:DNA-binding Lrp family transcriptional regulator
MILVMDAIDRKILAVLQDEGRLTVTELAQRVGLSAAPCHRRMRELERTGAIRGYRAVIDPAVVGRGFEVLMSVTMDREESVAAFEAGLAAIDEVVHAERLFGEPDYFVRVATADIAAFQKLRDERLARLPGVQRQTSTIVMMRVVDNRPLPT